MVDRVAGTDRLAEFRSATASLVVGAPSDAARAERFRRILAWYGVAAGSLVPVPPPPDDVDRHVLVPLDPTLRPRVEAYARITGGRPVLAPEDVRPPDWASVTLVGPPAMLTLPDLRRWSAAITGTLGVLTGRDPRGLDFMMAKQLSLPARWPLGTSARLDELHDEVGVWTSAGPTLPEPLTSQLLDRTLGLDLDLLHVHAHGEGGHANLRHVVLCGQVRPERVAPQSVGWQAGHGQVLDCDGERCKRAVHTGNRYRTVRDLRAAQLLFFSCNGFTVAGELYPGMSSVVLAVCEGYPATAVCNDRSVPTDRDEVRVAFELARTAGVGAACRLLNSRFSGEGSVLPWSVVGDALTADRAPVAPGEAQVHELDAGADVVRISSVRAPSAVVRGGQRVLVVGGAGHTVMPASHVEDMVGRMGAALRWSLFHETLLDVIADYARPGGLARAGADPVLDRARTACGQLRRGLGRAQRRLTGLVSAGLVRGEEAEETWAVCERLLAVWSRAWAGTLEHVLDRHLEEPLLAMAGPAHPGRTVGCPRCHSRCPWMHSTDLTGLDVPLAHLSCPTCGLLDTVCGEGLVPDVDVAGTWTGTDDLVVTLRTRGARTLWVAGSLRDKARGVEPYRHPLAAPTSELRLPPLDLSHDLHTLRLVCAGSTSWSLHRRRIACLPRTCRPASARHSQPHS